MKNSIYSLVVVLVLATFSTLQAQDNNPSEALKEFVGQYNKEGNAGFNITVSIKDDKLHAQPTDKSQPLTELVLIEKDKYDLQNTGGLKISFARDENGKITHLTFSSGGNQFNALKEKN